jgi:hypothetical protein
MLDEAALRGSRDLPFELRSGGGRVHSFEDGISDEGVLHDFILQHVRDSSLQCFLFCLYKLRCNVIV